MIITIIIHSTIVIAKDRVMIKKGCLSAAYYLNHVDDWGVVSRVVDGDTVHLEDGRKIRIIGINTPEIGYLGKQTEKFARKAQQVVSQFLAKNKKIGLIFDQQRYDHYHRLLAYIILSDGRSLGQELVKQGLAISIAIPPNTQHIHCLRHVEKYAKNRLLGVWHQAKMQRIDARAISKKVKGYRLIQGTVRAYHESQKSIYLQLTRQLAIRISKNDRDYFTVDNLKSLVGEKVALRGWISSYKNRQSIHLRSGIDLQIIQ
jgi:endonuclease YncB( thermonuclease family)